MSIRQKKGSHMSTEQLHQTVELSRAPTTPLKLGSSSNRTTPVPHPHQDTPPGLHRHCHNHQDGDTSCDGHEDMEEGGTLLGKVRTVGNTNRNFYATNLLSHFHLDSRNIMALVMLHPQLMSAGVLISRSVGNTSGDMRAMCSPQ